MGAYTKKRNMKLTSSKLKQLIKEELRKILKEGGQLSTGGDRRRPKKPMQEEEIDEGSVRLDVWHMVQVRCKKGNQKACEAYKTKNKQLACEAGVKYFCPKDD